MPFCLRCFLALNVLQCHDRNFVNGLLCQLYPVLFRHKIEHRCPEKESQGLAPMTLEGLLENPEKDWKEKL